MLFGLGALGFAALLAWLTLTELRNEKPTGWIGWGPYIGVSAGIVCTTVVAIRAML